MRDVWVEAGMGRYRTTFSASGVDPGTFCQFWKDGGNIQCGWDPNVDGGWWRVDANFYRGPLGDAMYYHMLDVLRENWRKTYGCTRIGVFWASMGWWCLCRCGFGTR